ncbi:MAG TPA: AAA family ATPase [Aquella sp.]|nr:AAA family ATPase [Aquella sp.]
MTKLRAVKPEAIQKRLKLFIYGNAKVGKTTAAIQFPNAYFIDTETGAEQDKYIEILQQKESMVWSNREHKNDFDEILEEIKSLLTEKHNYKTVIIDPLTHLYDDLVDKCAEKLKNSSKEKDATGMEFGRHYSEASKKMKHLVRLLSRLDMNVIITSHAKNEYGNDMKILGTTFDCYKKMDYLFDLIIEVQKRGEKRIAIVKGSRVRGFEDTEQFPFSYEIMANKYGKEQLERDAIPVVLANIEQVKELTKLIELFKVPEEVYRKWLDKADAENLSEMSTDNIQKCIDLLNKKLTNQ